jgi:hypothetical protein
MRALNTEFELFEATRVPVGVLRLQRPATAHEPVTLSPWRGLYYAVDAGGLSLLDFQLSTLDC